MLRVVRPELFASDVGFNHAAHVQESHFAIPAGYDFNSSKYANLCVCE